MNQFHEYTAKPVALAAMLNPVWVPVDISWWLSVSLQIAGLILVAVQARYWWKKK